MLCTVLFILLMLFLEGVQSASQQRFSSTKFKEVRVDEKSFEYARRLHINWYLHALKALFGQLGKQLYQKLPHDKRLSLAACLNDITDELDIVRGARCLVQARVKLRQEKQQHQKRESLPVITNYFDSIRKNPEISKKQSLADRYQKYLRRSTKQQSMSDNPWESWMSKSPKASNQRLNGSYAVLKAQAIKSENSRKFRKLPKIHPEGPPIRPLSHGNSESGPKIISRWKRSPYRLISSHAYKSDSIVMDVKHLRNHPPLNEAKLSLVQKVTKLVHVLYRGTKKPGNWIATYNRILDFKKKLDENAKTPGARVYQLRLYDLVLGRDYPSKQKRKDGKNRRKDLFAMVYDFINSNTRKKHEQDLNFKLLSPRLMPVMPDKMKSRKRLLSPSVLSFYNDDSPDSVAVLPKIFEKTGLSERDREAILEMIMDVSGAKQAVELAIELFNNRELYGLEGDFFEVTQRLSNVFKSLEKAFSEGQRKEMDKKGYTFLEAKQYKILLSGHGVNKSEDVDVNMDRYERLDRRKREDALWEHIEAIARNDTTKANWRREKREAISVLSPVVLSPYMFSPVFGVSIIGPVVLSPNIFSPLIFNPSVLGPFVLNPAVAMPFLISPYILSPYVLTPIVMAPFVLNPYILSPNVVNPYLLSPLVLSPALFCPDVLSPQALGGAYLSPNIFSPAIGTESYLMASILSPTWMS